MKKSDYQRFCSFKDKHQLTYSQIISIVTEYANSEHSLARTYFTSRYNISRHVFYKIRDYAIIFMLVDGPTCKKIAQKAFYNQSGHNTSGNCTSSVYHYRDLLKARKNYIDSFSKDQIVEISKLYAENHSLFDISKEVNVSTQIIRRLLAKGIAEHLVDETTYLAIKARSDSLISRRRGYSGPTVENLWSHK